MCFIEVLMLVRSQKQMLLLLLASMCTEACILILCYYNELLCFSGTMHKYMYTFSGVIQFKIVYELVNCCFKCRILRVYHTHVIFVKRVPFCKTCFFLNPNDFCLISRYIKIITPQLIFDDLIFFLPYII